ncbi:outer membrane beta-barrel family protein [Chitinophaga varians]|uniref:outer membrane beta-barrel family protein n=1 Tax=Chitinophaga varians TaxID=2202339 RepID=UPI00165F21B7|nr:outer membrane beta-barrel family protein [Chitinophaga varians]MBC9909894.1 TonB-dependent receptor [Chitinophaga varians]
MKQIFLILCYLGMTIPAFSQTYTLKGSILSATAKGPVIGAAVLLQSQKDPTRQFRTVSGPDGGFSLALPADDYTLNIRAMNFTPYFRAVTLPNNTDLGNIPLTDNVKQLSTVQVQGEKSTIELKTDKKVFNVGKDILSKGGNANDILNNVPAVNVDIQGNVSLRDNQNVRVLINGKPSMQTQNNGLSQIPAATIDKIEVITNPSAAYEAQGSAGIINIILKKNAALGFNASLQAGLASPKNNSVNLNASYKTQRLNLFTNIGYRDQGVLLAEDMVRVNKSPYNQLQQTNRADLNADNINFYLGTDFYLNERNTITASYYRTKRRNKDTNNSLYRYYNLHGTQDSVISRLEDYREPQIFNELELNYVRTFKQPNRKWTTYMQYDFWNDDENQHIRQFNLPSEANAINLITRDIESSKDIYLQSDYKQPLPSGQLETGIRGQWRAIRSEYSAAQDGKPLAGNNNKLFYDENIYAAYAQYSNKWKRLEAQLGLRGELSAIHISDREQTIDKRKQYLDFFPTLHLQYGFKDDWSLQASYSRRINRPKFWQLNTFAGLSDQRFLQRGNPDIDPMYTHVVELALLKKTGSFSVNPGIYYQYTTHYFGAVIEPQTDGNFVRTWANMGNEHRYGLDMTTTYNPYTWWRLSWDINWYSYSQRGEYAGKTYTADNTTWFTTVRSSMRFPKILNIDGSFTYRGRRQEVQVTVAQQYRANIGFSKDLLGDRMSLTFSINNLFDSNISLEEMDVPDYSMYYRLQQKGIIYTGNVVYRLNRKKSQSDRLPAEK